MTAADPFLFLLGSRKSIERIAGSRIALWIGALLVITAGIARNYDHLLLTQQFEWIYGPFLMSLFSAILMFFSLSVGVNVDRCWREFGVFVSFFWLTAPCAWLYAIPVESFTDILTATKWNVAFLAIVSLWRVFLITRVVSVLTGARTIQILCCILIPASVEMGIGSFFKGISLVGIMSGVRLPPHHVWLKNVSQFIVFGSICSFIIACSVGSILSLKTTERKGIHLARPSTDDGRGVFSFAFAAMAVWLAIAWVLQPSVQRKHDLDKLIRAENWTQAIEFASRHQPDDFPPAYEFPPGSYGRDDTAGRLLAAMTGNEPAWLTEIWMDQWCTTFDLMIMPRSIDQELIRTLAEKYPEFKRKIESRVEDLRRPDTGESGWEKEWLSVLESTLNSPSKQPGETK